MDESPAEVDVTMSQVAAPLAIEVQEASENDAATGEVVFDLHDVNVYYGQALAVAGVSLEIYKNHITAMIGPSGCGKSTIVRSLNRMNDSVSGFRLTGECTYHGLSLIHI